METQDAPQDAGLSVRLIVYTYKHFKTNGKHDWSTESKEQGARRN
jgi:hypothetical protein